MDWFIDLRAHSHGGPLGTLKVGDGTKFFPDFKGLMDEMRGCDVIFVAHGYNVNRPHGTNSLNLWKASFLKNIATPPIFVGVLWPGDCILPIFIDYVWEGSEAEKGGTMLGEFVRDNCNSAASISFAAHSLGSRLVLQAIQTLDPNARVRNLILMAAAIEDDTLQHEFNIAAQKVDRLSIAYSMQDHVLQMAYPAGNLLGGLIERGDPNVKAALGRLGPSAPWAGKIIANPRLPQSWNYGHTDYMPSESVPLDYPLPVGVPDPNTPIIPPGTPPDLERNNKWKSCWSPAFAATRWLLP